MAENSKIEWTHHTFNPWLGCTKVSPACDGCYAEAMIDLRFGRMKWGGPRIRTAPENWRKPLKWNETAKRSGIKQRVFCASLADVFDNQVSAEWRTDLFRLIEDTPHLVWMLLTKRPHNIVAMIKRSGIADSQGKKSLPRNAALGTTVEDQKRADTNIPALLRAKEACTPEFAFVLCEPLLGSLDLRTLDLQGVDWVLAGGETDQGPHRARPMHPDWLRGLRDQCRDAGVPFHFRGWGEYRALEADRAGIEPQQGLRRPSRILWMSTDGQRSPEREALADQTGNLPIERLGRKRTGRRLDGVEHDGLPAKLRAGYSLESRQ